MAAYDTDELLATIQQDATLPAGTRFTAARLLKMADDETRTLIVPELVKRPGRLLAARTDIPLVSGQAAYQIPERAIRLLDVWWVDASGVERELVRVENGLPPRNARPGTPRRWYFEGGSVVLDPAPNVAGNLRLSYDRWPSRLVLPSAAGIVTGIVSEPFQGATIDGLTPGDLELAGAFDVVRAKPGFDLLAANLVGVDNTPYLEFALPVGISVGDYVCRAGESPVPQIPVPFHPVLAAAVVCRVLRAQGDSEALAIAEADLERKKEAASIVAPRASAPAIIVNRTWG